MDDEQSHDDENGVDFNSEDPTVVIVRRITREEVSKGLRLLAAASGGFRVRLYESATHIDAGTALGYKELTQGEAEDLDAELEDIESMAKQSRVALKRATGPGPTEEP